MTSIPTTFFVNKEGVITDVMTGYHGFDELKEKALSDGEPSEVPGEGIEELETEVEEVNVVP